MKNHSHPPGTIKANCKHKMEYCAQCDMWQCQKCDKEWNFGNTVFNNFPLMPVITTTTTNVPTTAWYRVYASTILPLIL